MAEDDKILSQLDQTRGAYALQIAEELEANYANRRQKRWENLVFAISGEWGEGKTDILDKLEPLLEDKGFKVIKFNPWRFAHDEISIKRAFLKTIQHDLGKTTTDLSDLDQDKSLVALRWPSPSIWRYGFIVLVILYLMAVHRNLSLLTFLDRGFSHTAIKELITPLAIGAVLALAVVNRKQSEVTTQDRFKEKFDELIKGNTKVVFFIDDLDRCTPGTVKIILDALRTFLIHEECSYVVTGDSGVIEQYAVSALKAEGDTEKVDPEEGRRFLKKIFNVYWSVPLPTVMEFREYIEQELDRVSEGADWQINDTARKNISNLLLEDSLFRRNLRHAKRLIDKLAFLMKTAHQKHADVEAGQDNKFVSLQDVLQNPDLLFKVVVMEDLFYPVYREISVNPTTLVHQERAIKNSDSSVLYVEGSTVQGILERSGVTNPETKTYQYTSKLISRLPRFIDELGTVKHAPSLFLSLSGGSDSELELGVDPATLAQKIKQSDFLEVYLETLKDGIPTEKNTAYADQVKKILSEAATSGEGDDIKFNVINNSLRLGHSIEAWAKLAPTLISSFEGLEESYQAKAVSSFFPTTTQNGNYQSISDLLALDPKWIPYFWNYLKETTDENDDLWKLASEVITNQLDTPDTIHWEALDVAISNPKVETALLNALQTEQPLLETLVKHVLKVKDLGIEEASSNGISTIKDFIANGFALDDQDLEYATVNQEQLKSLNLWDSLETQVGSTSKTSEGLEQVLKYISQPSWSNKLKATLVVNGLRLIESGSSFTHLESPQWLQLVDSKSDKEKLFDGIIVGITNNFQLGEKALDFLERNNAFWNTFNRNNRLIQSSLAKLSYLKDLTKEGKEHVNKITTSWQPPKKSKKGRKK